MLIKDVLQYFNYFIRPEFRQKPDVEMATEYYKEIADKKTVDELRLLVGQKHKINFEELGNKSLELDGGIVEDYENTEEGVNRYLIEEGKGNGADDEEESLPDDEKYEGAD